MDGYELTERGKIVIALILVLLLLLVPAAILAYKTMENVPSHPNGNNDSGASAAVPPPFIESSSPGNIDSPPPSGGGFSNPPDVLSPGISSPDVSFPGGNGSPGGQNSAAPPQSGQVSVNPSEGTLSFSFSQTGQNALDSETISALDAFLSSPKNTQDAIIVVEIPALSDTGAEKLTNAVVSAFVMKGLKEQRLAFVTTPVKTDAESFEVNLYYTTRIEK